MLKFLKALFGYGAQPVKEGPVAVKLSDFESWLASAQEPLKTRVSQQLSSSKNKISQISSEIKEKVNSLQSAQLLNPNIPDRAKDYMTGNREEYSRRVLQYTDKITIPENVESLSSFLEQHRQDASEFTKGILRPFQILQEFFANESKEITAMLADIEREIEAVRQAHTQANTGDYELLKNEAGILAARQKQLSGLRQEQAELEKHRNEAEKSVQALNTEEERLLKDPARAEALKKISEAREKVKAHEQKIRDVFANFEPALRKFYRMATRNVRLVERYLRDPVATLIEDLHLEILEAVEDIRRLLKFDRLQLGDKKEYVLDAMAMLEKNSLGTWLREYGQLTKAEKDAYKAVENCDATRTLVRVQKLREETMRNAQLSGQRLAQVSKDIEKISLDQMRARLEEKTKMVTGKDVSIIL